MDHQKGEEGTGSACVLLV